MTELFHDDRCYAALPDNIDAPTMAASDLLPGDVLLFRGVQPMSNGIRFWDDCSFDHGALVISKPPAEVLERFDESDHQGPWIRDISFAGVRTYPLVAYDEPVSHILVRRHRVAGWREPVTEYSEMVREDTAGYNFHHGLTLILASLSRTASRLRENADRWDQSASSKDVPLEQRVGAIPRAYVANLHMLFAAASTRVTEPEKKFRICVQYVRDSFDVLSEPSGGEDAGYFGLVLEERPNDGLLAWAASGRTFVEYLQLGTFPRVADGAGFDPEAELRSLAHSIGLSVSALPYRDPEAVTDDDLRRSLVQSARSTLRLLGWREDENSPPFPPTQEAVPAMAAYLLDELMRHRFLISQFDIASTKSLYDAGMIDVEAVRWRRLPKPYVHMS